MKWSISQNLLISFAAISLVLKTGIGYAQNHEDEILNMRKTALVIGIASYTKGNLAHTLNDAHDMTDSLRKIGFKVFPYYDADKATLNDAIDNWIDSLGNFQVALFYFSGHGSESPDGNYLFPANANPGSESELITKCVSANSILERMEKTDSKYNLMILDACRNNPFTKGWFKGAETEGLSPMSGAGSFIGFAALPRHTASDGSSVDRNGIYTAAILKYITKPNRTIDQIFTNVSAAVEEASSGKQTPFRESTLTADMYLSVAHQPNVRISGLSSFTQPPSTISLSEDELEMVAVDDGAKEVLTFDANSFARLATRPIKSAASEIICKKGKYVYILDSVSKMLEIWNLPDLGDVGRVNVPGIPTAFTISSDEKRAYISYRDSTGKGFIGEVDLLSGIGLKQIANIPCPSNLVLSSDNSRLFVISNCKASENSLIELDTKSLKTRKSANVAAGLALAISPDNRRIYASYDTSGSSPETNIIEVSSLKILNPIPIKSRFISFAADGKYGLFADDRTASIVRLDSDLIINNFSFFNQVGGIAPTRDGRIIVWIPKEHNPIVRELKTLLEKVDNRIEDPRLQEFNRRMKKNLKDLTDSNEIRILARLKDTIWAFPDKFAKQLEGKYHSSNGGPEYFYDRDSMIVYSGITLQIDEHKSIYFTFCVKYDHGYIRIDCFDRQNGSRGKIDYKFHADNFEWKLLEAKLNEIYLDRINTQLILSDKSQ
jgi:caspase domain-containing protein